MGFFDFLGRVFRSASTATAAPIPPPVGHPEDSAFDILENVAKDAATSLAEQALFAMVRRSLEQLPSADKQLEVIEAVQNMLVDYADLLQRADDSKERRIEEAEKAFKTPGMPG